ncbi:hypothetical protein GO730_18575 [Spirosoma sp. HMF3257]|uniref:Uncharacterized protein n=1 Tax=Spirosoma telluris TaxID=2183553 RepID=A0A327NKB8_9BACT|nr:hypothetical protein [Spirosoma telluris]RAI75647.1 hypothetical protein HMF3257_18505 [Spirosoma telluris]
MTQIEYTNGKPVDVSPTNQWSIVTFKSNGTILYGDNGKYDPCCSPFRFKRKGNTLDLVDVEDIPFPERMPNPICASASCVSPGDAWQINVLTDSNLVIKQAYGITTYKLYP